MRSGFFSKALGSSRLRRNLERRQRGSLLFDAVLAIGVMMTFLAISVNVQERERASQEAALLGAEHKVVLDASKAYVAKNYKELQEELFARTGGSGAAIMSMSTDALIERGYLPPIYSTSGVLFRFYGQRYALLLRAVNRADATVPQLTMTGTQLDPAMTGHISPALLDLDPANGEMDIEALLVTYGGQEIKSGLAGRIMPHMNSAYAGYVADANFANGAYGGFRLNISRFNGRAEYPARGRFASVVALSNFGVLGERQSEDGLLDAFRRCVDVDPATAAYLDCMDTNEVYSDIVLAPHDTDGNGTADTFPAIRGLSLLECGNTSTRNNATGRFMIDCAETTATGNVNVEGNLKVDGDAEIGALEITDASLDYHDKTIVERHATRGNILHGDAVVSDTVNGGQDLSEAIIDSRVVFAGQTVAKPQCTGLAPNGAPMTPRIYVTPAAYSDPEGRAIIGVRAYASEHSSTQWRVRVLAFVGQDFCTNTPANAIQPGYTLATNGVAGAPSHGSAGASGTVACTAFGPGGVITTDRGDGQSDVYELGPTSGAVLVQTRCY